jgi:hypothetical protein
MSLENNSEKQQQHIPNIKWYQTKDLIFISFEIINHTNELIKIEENKINFNALSYGINYSINIELLYNINTDESSYNIDEKFIKIILKKNDNENWTRLTLDKNSYKNNIKIDWNAWINEDSDDEIEKNQPNQNFDFQSMMQNMGGMNGMEDMYKNMASSMGGMNFPMNDEDDEDVEENLENNEEDLEEDNTCENCDETCENCDETCENCNETC